MIDGLPMLAGNGVLLRQLAEADIGRLFAVFSDPEVMRYWSRGPFASEAEARALQDALREAGRARTMLDIAREQPLRFVLYLTMVAALVAVSIVPFLRLP